MQLVQVYFKIILAPSSGEQVQFNSVLQFFSVHLVHFLDQKLHFQNYLFNLHII